MHERVKLQTYLKPCQSSLMELFSNIYYGPVNYFHKKVTPLSTFEFSTPYMKLSNDDLIGAINIIADFAFISSMTNTEKNM